MNEKKPVRVERFRIVVLWNVVGQAVRYGVKGVGMFMQTEAGKRLEGSISPPEVVQLDNRRSNSNSD